MKKITNNEIIGIGKTIDNIVKNGRKYCSNLDDNIPCFECKYNVDGVSCSSMFLAEKLHKFLKECANQFIYKDSDILK